MFSEFHHPEQLFALRSLVNTYLIVFPVMLLTDMKHKHVALIIIRTTFLDGLDKMYVSTRTQQINNP